MEVFEVQIPEGLQLNAVETTANAYFAGRAGRGLGTIKSNKKRTNDLEIVWELRNVIRFLFVSPKVDQTPSEYQFNTNFRLCIKGLLRGIHIQRPFWAKPFQEMVDPSKHQDCRRHIALIEALVTQHLLPTFCYSLKQKRRGVLSKCQSMKPPGLMYFPLHDLFQQQDPLTW